MESTRVAIAALSFQDPMAQNLRSLGETIEDARKRISVKLGAEPPSLVASAEPEVAGLAAGSVELF